MGLFAGTCRIGFVLSIAIEPDSGFSIFHTCLNSLIANLVIALARFCPKARHISSLKPTDYAAAKQVSHGD